MEKSAYFKEDGLLTQTENYILRSCCGADKNNYLELLKENSIFAGNQSMSEGEFTQYLDYTWESLTEDDSINVSVFRKDDLTYVASISLRDLASETPELGIDVLREYHRQGIATEVIPAFARRILELGNLKYFLVRIYSDNEPSTGLFTKLGAIPIAEEPSELAAFMQQAKALLGDKYDEILAAHPGAELALDLRHIVQYKYLPRSQETK